MASSDSGSMTEPQAVNPSSDRLTPAFDHWQALPWRMHLLALIVLAIAGLPRYWTPLSAPFAHIDESLYERAFEMIAQDRSPYEVPGYYYPSAFAYFGHWLVESLGTVSARQTLRVGNYLALLITLWLSAAWWGRLDGAPSPKAWRAAWFERVAFAGLLLVFAPGIAEGIYLGNLSFLAIGLALVGLTFAGQRPLVAGLALALSVALKPIAAAIFPLLVLTPPAGRAWAHRLAGILGGALTLVLWLAFPYFFELLGQSVEHIGFIRTWSLYRLADVLHFDIGRLGLLTLLILAALAAGHWARASRPGWLALAATASVLATPLIWGHTLIIVFPVLAMTGSLARHRWQHRDGRHHDKRRNAWAEPVFITLGGAVVLFYNAGAIDLLPLFVEALLLLIPAATLVALTAYVVRYSPHD